MRLFFAIDISEDIRSKIDEFVFKNYQLLGKNKFSWVKKENLHITIKFLGETKEDLLPKINKNLCDCVKKYKSFKLEISGIGVFPKISFARVLWFGVKNSSRELDSLFNDIEEKLYNLGFQKEKKDFNPHLTVARVRLLNDIEQLKFFIEKFKDINFGFSEAKDVILYQSILKPEGPEYKVVEKYCLM